MPTTVTSAPVGMVSSPSVTASISTSLLCTMRDTFPRRAPLFVDGQIHRARFSKRVADVERAVGLKFHLLRASPPQ